ncbi:hypothetical protein [Nocardia asiatica]|uniref:hypothetical protein n=1 Tax=Nocardia asiatica TaxID=209252 RepID=UPI002455D352|nr:hypothetical protein [Nocardia asiatica]
MRRGFVIEEHVVVYCDTCGDYYSEREQEAICFESVTQAIAYLTVRAAGVGWVYDGDRVVCDGCQATARCVEHGHCFPESWRTTVWALGNSTRSRTCTVCGVPEIEAQP